MSEEDDDKVREVLRSIFAPDWAKDLGQRIGTGLKERTSDQFRDRANAAARRYVDFVNPKVAQARQDEEIEENKRKIGILQKYAAPARDGGEIDEPQPTGRQAIQMQREFSNDAEKQAYLERIREAQRKVSETK